MTCSVRHRVSLRDRVDQGMGTGAIRDGLHRLPNKRMQRGDILMPMRACPICGQDDRVRLPDPHVARSMLSDGRIWNGPLDKAACNSCGAVTHATILSAGDVQRFYDSDYDLGVDAGVSDVSRNLGYAAFVHEIVSQYDVRRILEIGCGSGHVLGYLARHLPQVHMDGIEAAEQLAANSPPGVQIRKAFLEELEFLDQGYDFAFCINVIEHAADPSEFLRALRGQLSASGTALIVCPAPSPPNLELLFRDHVSSFTPASLRALAIAAGFRVVAVLPALERFPGFQAFILTAASNGGGQAVVAENQAGAARAAEAAAYLSAWASLDRALCARMGDSVGVDLFGAGEMAALLRCYAPECWRRVDRLVVDSLAGARSLDKPMATFDDIGPSRKPIIVATHPQSQGAVAQRLFSLDLSPIVFNDMIKA